MTENRFLAGIVSGLPITLVCLAYALARRDYVMSAFAGRADGEAMSQQAATLAAFAAAAFVGPGLGLVAALVYGWMPSDGHYLALALVLATLMSIAAVASRTPMTAEKIVLNYLVAASLGLILPRLLGR